VNNVPPAELKKALQPLVTPGGAVLEQPGSKSLMIVDNPENTRRLLEIKELLDVPALASAHFDIYEAKGAAAEELSASLNEVARNGIIAGDPFAAVMTLALPSDNRVLIVGQTDAGVGEARRWLERFDLMTSGTRRVYIYPLGPKDTEAAQKALTAWRAAKKTAVSNTALQAEGRLDSPTNSLIVYGTAQEFQELKNAINPDTKMAEFKQRIAAVAKRFGAETKPTTQAP
jgi:type II secretory pathway component GspD/PulD (secretin)